MKNKKSLYWKFGLGLLLFVLVITKINFKLSQDILSRVSLGNFLTVLCIYLLGQTLSAYKWSLISKHTGFTCTFGQYVRFYFQGMFYNQFLPTGVGGDIIKGYFLYQHDKTHLKPEDAAASVLFDRISGVFVLLLLLLTGNILYFKQLPAWVNLIQLGVIAATALGTGLMVFLSYKRDLFKYPIVRKILFFTHLYFDKILVKILAVSLLFHLMVVTIHILIGRDLNLNISWSYYLILYPATAILTSLPISLNGIGIREWAYLFFLGLVGIPSSAAFIFALYWAVLMLVTSLLGALFLLNWKKHETRTS